MKNPILNEVRRVTGWHFLMDHELFPLLLAAVTSTSVLWFFPGIDRIAAAYQIRQHGMASVSAAAPRAMATSVSEIEVPQMPL